MTRERRRGIVLVSGSAAAYSTAGFFTRLIPLDPWTLLFWRGLFSGLFLLAWLVLREGRAGLAGFARIGAAGAVVSLSCALSMILYINAFRHGSVADVVIILATLPFVTAALGRVALGIRESRATLAASALALAGIGVMLAGFRPAGAASGPFAGALLAGCATVLLAIMMLALRRHHATPMLQAMAVAAFLAALLVAPAARPLAPGAREMAELLAFGVTQSGLGLLLLTLGMRVLPATWSALIGNLEVPLAVLWVWLGFGAVLWHVLSPDAHAGKPEPGERPRTAKPGQAVTVAVSRPLPPPAAR